MKKFTLKKDGSSLAVTIVFDLEKKFQPHSELSYEAKISLPPSEVSVAMDILRQKKPPPDPGASQSRSRKGSLLMRPLMLDYVIVDYFEELSESSHYWLQHIGEITPLQGTPGSSGLNEIAQIQLVSNDAKQQHASKGVAHTFCINLEFCADPSSQTKHFKWEMIEKIINSISPEMEEVIRIRNSLTADRPNVILPGNFNYTPTTETVTAYGNFIELYATPRSSAAASVEPGILSSSEASRKSSIGGETESTGDAESPGKLSATPRASADSPVKSGIFSSSGASRRLSMDGATASTGGAGSPRKLAASPIQQTLERRNSNT